MTAAEPEFYTHETVPGDYVKKVDVDGRTRDFRVHIPAAYDGTRPLPLILVFHGSSADAGVIERETSFDHLGDSLGAFIVYPQGLHRGWNIGECCRYSFVHRVDEAAFVSAILDRLERGFRVDSTRVYATGYSDGGTLAYILGCQLSDRIAAVAGVSATLFDPRPRCVTPKPVPAMVIHGTGDSHIPYAGQPGARADVRMKHLNLSAPDVAAFWIAHDTCAASPERVRVRRVTRERYECADGAEVLFYTITGGEHGWPGGGRGWIFSPRPPTDMNASDTIASFFLRHRLAPGRGPRNVQRW